jgi:drug/metabolite transporter (DMT)-like permease
MFLLLEPIITAILGWLIFDESLSPVNLLTFCVVLVGLYLAKSGQGVDKVDTKIVGVEMAAE